MVFNQHQLFVLNFFFYSKIMFNWSIHWPVSLQVASCSFNASYTLMWNQFTKSDPLKKCWKSVWNYRIHFMYNRQHFCCHWNNVFLSKDTVPLNSDMMQHALNDRLYRNFVNCFGNIAVSTCAKLTETCPHRLDFTTDLTLLVCNTYTNKYLVLYIFN